MDQPQEKDKFFNPLSVPPQTTSSGEAVKVKKRPVISKKLIIVLLLLLFLAGLIYGINQFTGLFSEAGGDYVPQNIRVAELTANSVEITFQTGKTCKAEIAYGTGNQSESLLLQVPEPMASLNHRIRLTPLLPATTYYYQVNIDGKPVGPIYSFLTLASSGGVVPVATARPTLVPTAPVPVVSVAPVYTFEDFMAKLGTNDAVFDLDKNGLVNMGDWLEYQKTKPTPSLP